MGTTALITALLLAPAAEPKPDEAPAPVKKVVDAYLKAVAAKDLDAMADLAGLPWLDRDRTPVRDRAKLRPALERVASQLPKSEGERKLETAPYKQFRDSIKDEAVRKLLDEILGDDGWLVSVLEDGYPLSERYLLVRVKGGKATVVAGPLKPNQLTPQNRMPDVVERLLDRADTFELYSLDPDERRARGKAAPPKDTFHDWAVLGKTKVTSKADRKRLADALRLGVEDNFGMAAGCFIPRHGIRLKDGDRTVDLVICFECLSVQVFEDGKAKPGFLTTGGPQPTFDAVLKAAGVKLPKPAKE